MMGYLDQFKGQQLITNPESLFNYRKVNKVKNSKDEVVNDRELVKEMKGKLEPDEFKKWYHKHTYQKRKDKVHQQYLDKKALEENLAIESYHELFDDEPGILTPFDLDKEHIEWEKQFYLSKAKRWVFYWWISRLKYLSYKTFFFWDKPIRVCKNMNMKKVIKFTVIEQQKIAEILKPHLSEFTLKDIIQRRNQVVSSRLNLHPIGRLREIILDNALPNNFACCVASALLRGVYIDGLCYLGHTNFLIGDLLATEKGQAMLPALDCSVPYLKRETREDIHQRTKDWLDMKDVKVPNYIVEDCYLIEAPASKFQNEEGEDDNNNSFYYYVVPFNYLKYI